MTNIKSVSRFQHQTGISNIQIMVGVLISAILILGGMGLIRYIDKTKVNNDLNELTELKARTVAYAAQHGGDFSGITQELVIGLDFFPANRVSGAVGSRTISNQWKGEIKVGPGQVITGGAWDSIEFEYYGVPSSACKELAMQASSIASYIYVGNTSVKTFANPVNEALAIQACDAENDNAYIRYFMSK